MINGIHALVYARDAEQVRAFFRDVLGWAHVDAGRGWLIFALPPAEIAAHPAGNGGESGRTELYVMCDDVHATVAALKAKGVEVLRPVADQGWGLVTAINVPGFGEMGMYQPKHPIAHGAGKPVAAKATKGSPKKKAKKKAAKPRAKTRAKARPARRR